MILRILVSLVVILAAAALFFRPRFVWALALLVVVPIPKAILACLSLPALVRDFLREAVIERRATQQLHSAQVAAVLWNTGSDFRPAARQILSNVCIGFGIRPNFEETPAKKGHSSYGDGLVSRAASLVNAGSKDDSEIKIPVVGKK